MAEGRVRGFAVHLLALLVAVFTAGTMAAQQNVSLKPSTGMAGTSVDVVLQGGYVDPQSVTIAFQPPGLSVRNARLEARQLAFTIDIAPNARAGEYTLVITPNAPPPGTRGNAGAPATPFVVPNAFRVMRVVRITSIQPNQITAGTTTDVTITGSGFAPNATLIFVGAHFVTATVKNVTDSMMTASIKAAPNASLGTFGVIVENVDGSASHEQQPLPTLSVVAPKAAPQPPVVRSITPANAAQGATLLLRVDGAGFQQGAVVTLGSGVTAKVVSVAPAHIVVNAAVAPSAPAGPHRVIVRNPDGLSNEAQPRPVDLTITAAAPPAQPPARPDPPAKTDPPPVKPPVKTDPPPVKTDPPAKPPQPPVVTPPKTTPTPPVVKPPVPPQATPPAKPPVATPPVATPPAAKPPVLAPPSTVLQGPRVDSVKPQSLTPGLTYLLDLDGKNFSADTKVTLGQDVTVVGVPLVLSPTKARLQVIVSPGAKAGVVAALATNAAGHNKGPGGVMIASPSGGKKNNNPGSKPAAKPAEKPADTGQKQPMGTIKLTKPCDPMYGFGCDEVPLLHASVEFTWKELSPGLAQLFVFEIVNAKEQVLYTAQTQSPHLQWSSTKLVSFLDKMAAGGPAAIAANAGSTPGAGTSTSGVSTPSASNAVLAGGGSSPQGQPHAKKLTDFELLVKAYPNAVYWRVRGMRQKASSAKKEMYVAAVSDVRPLVLPKAPAGFSCPTGAKSKISLVPVPGQEALGAPCDKKNGKYSTNICSGMKARFSPSSVVDLSKAPFDLGQMGSIGDDGNKLVLFYGVYVDWGDGSEPYPLIISGTESPSLTNAKIETSLIEHTYKNKSGSDEFQNYVVRIYAIGGDTPQSLSAIAKAASKAGASGEQGTGKGVHTLACTGVKVWNEVDATKDGPLTLISAVTVFPDDWAKLAELAQKAGLTSGTDLGNVPVNDALNLPGGGSKSGGGPSQAPPPKEGSSYNIDTSKMTSVSECSEAFRPFVRLRYYGRGRARVRWTLDGKVIEEVETPELPPVTESDAMSWKKSYDVDLTMPLPSKLTGGANIHKLEVHVETGALPGPMTSAGPSSGGGGMTGMTPGSTKLVSTNTPPVSGGGPSLAGAVPGQSAAKAAAGASSAAKAGIFDPGAGASKEGPFSAVDAKPRMYKVVAQLPGVPCRIVYKTANSGTLVISDITDFVLESAGSSGKGKLHIPLASDYGSTKVYASVSFDKWQIEPQQGDATQFTALSGMLKAKTTEFGSIRNFPVRISAVALDAQQLLLDGTVSLPQGNLTAPLGEMPKWPFFQVQLQPGGHFAFTSKSPGTIGLGNSQFKLDISEIAFDFGFMKAPASACTKSSFGGALVSGTLRAPEAVTFGTGSIFKDAKVGPWAITSKGLMVKADDLPIGTTVNEAGVTIATSAVSLKSCDGGIAPAFLLTMKGVPFFSGGVTGDGSLDAQGNLLVALQSATAAKSWSNADAEVSSLSLHREENWYFLANGSFAFRSYGKPFQKLEYEGLRLGFDGKVLLPPLPTSNVAQTTTSLAGFPFTITSFSAGTNAGALHFTFTGDLKFAEHVKSATNRDVTFKVPYTLASTSIAPAVQLADAPLFDEGPVALLAAPPEEGGGGDEPTVQSVDIDLSFPPGADTVRIKANSKWTSSASGYRFTTDNGSISVLGSVDIEKVRFVFGNDKGESYWLAQASYKLPAPIQLGTTPLYLYNVGGGLGHNVAITSFNAPIENIVAAHQPSSYLFSADVDVGTLDNGTTFWSNGRLTVQFGDGFAARADVKAWLLTSDHGQAPMGTGCVQYAGGAFAAGFGVHYTAVGGMLVVDAPVGSDACQAAAVHLYFASLNDFHIQVGSPAMRVSAEMAGAKGSGSFRFDPSGANFDFVVHYVNQVTLDVGICTAYAGYEFYWGLGAGFAFDPFSISGSANAGAAVGAGCGSFGVGAGGDVALAVTLPGSNKICGALHIFVKVLGKKKWLINTGNFCI